MFSAMVRKKFDHQDREGADHDGVRGRATDPDRPVAGGESLPASDDGHDDREDESLGERHDHVLAVGVALHVMQEEDAVARSGSQVATR